MIHNSTIVSLSLFFSFRLIPNLFSFYESFPSECPSSPSFSLPILMVRRRDNHQRSLLTFCFFFPIYRFSYFSMRLFLFLFLVLFPLISSSCCTPDCCCPGCSSCTNPVTERYVKGRKGSIRERFIQMQQLQLHFISRRKLWKLPENTQVSGALKFSYFLYAVVRSTNWMIFRVSNSGQASYVNPDQTSYVNPVYIANGQQAVVVPPLNNACNCKGGQPG